jgi:hypothetical protein
MEEKNLVLLPEEVVEYLDFMKEKNYTLKGVLNVVIGEVRIKKFMNDYLGNEKNQEKVALAWLNGYKTKEKNFIVKFKNMDDSYSYLNYKQDECVFTLSTLQETPFYKTKFTKEFLGKNGFGWVLTCEGVELIEVEND